MSIEASIWALRQKCATATEKAVLLVVANYVGSDGLCWPGQPTIAAQACCHTKTVERCLAQFEERGWIRRSRRYRHGGYRTSDLIEFPQAAAPEALKTLPDILSAKDLTRQPVQSYQTACPILPDTVSGQEPLGEPLGTATTAGTRVRAEAAADGWPVGGVEEQAHLLVLMADTVRLDPQRTPTLRQTEDRLAAWRRTGVSFSETVIPVVMAFARQNGPPITTWAHFDDWVAESHDCWTSPL